MLGKNFDELLATLYAIEDRLIDDNEDAQSDLLKFERDFNELFPSSRESDPKYKKIVQKITQLKSEFDFYDEEAELDSMFPNRGDDDFDEDSMYPDND